MIHISSYFSLSFFQVPAPLFPASPNCVPLTPFVKTVHETRPSDPCGPFLFFLPPQDCFPRDAPRLEAGHDTTLFSRLPYVGFQQRKIPLFARDIRSSLFIVSPHFMPLACPTSTCRFRILGLLFLTLFSKFPKGSGPAVVRRLS